MITRLGLVTLAVALFALPVVPSASALDPTRDCDRGYGTHAVLFGEGAYACLDADVDWFDETPDVPDAREDGIQRRDCPDDPNATRTEGAILVVGDTRAGECLEIHYREPTVDPMDGYTGNIDASGCEIGGQEAKDPRVEAEGGGVGVCQRTVLDPGGASGGPTISTDPCSTDSIDPSVEWFGGGVFLCLKAGVH